MACLPPRVAELPLKRSATLLVLALLGSGAPLRAQEERAVPDRSAPSAALEAGLRITQIEQAVTVMPGGLLQVRIAPGVHLGGAGWVMTDPVALEGGAGTGLEMKLGYGGAALNVDLPASPSLPAMSGRLLLGAGNADVRDRASRVLLGSDNFAIVEAEAVLRMPLGRHLTFVGGGAYRHAFGVDDLPGVTARDVSAPSLVLALRLTPG